MEKDKFKTKVIFRFWKVSDDIIAIFPEMVATNDVSTCESYQHTGQHGACNPHYIINSSRLAKPEEYVDLKAELENHYGYDLIVIKKNRYEFIEKRRKQLKRVGE